LQISLIYGLANLASARQILYDAILIKGLILKDISSISLTHLFVLA